ncbi:MAG TPA: hypothetical protein VF145_00080 [Chitinophagaceae bacterium]
MEIINRMKKPTPRFFKKLRNIGLAIAAIGGSILTAPAELPELLVNIAGYLTVGGTVASAVSQSVTEPSPEDLWEQEIKKKRR